MKSKRLFIGTVPTLAAAMGVIALRPSYIQPPVKYSQIQESTARTAAIPMRALIVGGGPDLKHNQVAIESNVRYVSRLLLPGTTSRILFTDGNPDSKNVLYEDDSHHSLYRKPQLPRLDGPAELATVQSELTAISNHLKSNPTTPVLLYFTGHGGPDEASQLNNNRFDLWNNGELSVKDLASSLKSFPKSTPITVVMVECFSGAFGNLIFDGGDPSAPVADRKLCGFYASVPQREAAGCTPEINESDYHDFTGYFFAALTGTDRLGKTVSGADYNHDGKVTMSEAFDYTLLHDDSIDTPVCTSDVFLRRFVKVADKDVFASPYSKVRSWATHGQLAALDGLSQTLDMSGEDRLTTAYTRFLKTPMESMDSRDVHMIRFVRLAKSIVLRHELEGSSDEDAKTKFASLDKLEDGNPFRS